MIDEFAALEIELDELFSKAERAAADEQRICEVEAALERLLPSGWNAADL
jgi:hypothetical protein